MKINFSQIYEGWKNHLLPAENMKEHISKVNKKRMAICEKCELHSKNHKTLRLDDHCTNCGCPLQQKTKCLSCGCPLDKWLAEIATQEEEQTLINTIYGEQGLIDKEDSSK